MAKPQQPRSGPVRGVLCLHRPTAQPTSRRLQMSKTGSPACRSAWRGSATARARSQPDQTLPQWHRRTAIGCSRLSQPSARSVAGTEHVETSRLRATRSPQPAFRRTVPFGRHGVVADLLRRLTGALMPAPESALRLACSGRLSRPLLALRSPALIRTRPGRSRTRRCRPARRAGPRTRWRPAPVGSPPQSQSRAVSRLHVVLRQRRHRHRLSPTRVRHLAADSRPAWPEEEGAHGEPRAWPAGWASMGSIGSCSSAQSPGPSQLDQRWE
jgi:hypothetical protein